MADIMRDYYDARDNRLYDDRKYPGVSLMYKIIEDLNRYTNKGRKIWTFIRHNRSGWDIYVSEKEKQLLKKHSVDNKKMQFLRKKWKSDWERAAKREQFQAMMGVPRFIRRVESILSSFNPNSVEQDIVCDSDAIE